MVTGRRLSTTPDGIAIYPDPALFDIREVGGLCFHKFSTSHGGGAKGVDAPNEGAFVCLACLDFAFCASKPVFFSYARGEEPGRLVICRFVIIGGLFMIGGYCRSFRSYILAQGFDS